LALEMFDRQRQNGVLDNIREIPGVVRVPIVHVINQLPKAYFPPSTARGLLPRRRAKGARLKTGSATPGSSFSFPAPVAVLLPIRHGAARGLGGLPLRACVLQRLTIAPVEQKHDTHEPLERRHRRPIDEK